MFRLSRQITQISSGLNFQDCIVLEDIHLPETLTKIEDSTFALCRNLSAITIPQNVTHIGRWAFSS